MSLTTRALRTQRKAKEVIILNKPSVRERKLMNHSAVIENSDISPLRAPRTRRGGLETNELCVSVVNYRFACGSPHWVSVRMRFPRNREAPEKLRLQVCEVAR